MREGYFLRWAIRSKRSVIHRELAIRYSGSICLSWAAPWISWGGRCYNKSINAKVVLESPIHTRSNTRSQSLRSIWERHYWLENLQILNTSTMRLRGVGELPGHLPPVMPWAQKYYQIFRCSRGISSRWTNFPGIVVKSDPVLLVDGRFQFHLFILL